MFYHNPNNYQSGYYPYQGNPTENYPAPQNGYYTNMNLDLRQQMVSGQATWTNGGPVTQCGIPWSENQYMTVAVGDNSPYQCGQSIKIRNISNAREVIVTVVDQVRGYKANQVNLHQRAFEALGANLNQGIITIEIIPSPELEEEKWGKYLLELVQTAYPNYNVTDYSSVGKTELSPTQTRETFDFILSSQQEEIKVRGNVIYNPVTDRVVSFDLMEL